MPSVALGHDDASSVLRVFTLLVVLSTIIKHVPQIDDQRQTIHFLTSEFRHSFSPRCREWRQLAKSIFKYGRLRHRRSGPVVYGTCDLVPVWTTTAPAPF